MNGASGSKNKIVARFHPKNVEFANFIGAGPSIRSRSRLALLAAFLVVVPTLFISVLRIEKVIQHAALSSDYQDYLKEILVSKIAVRDLDLSLWAYTAEMEFENAQEALIASGKLKRSIARLVTERPDLIDIGPSGFLEGLVGRLDGLVKRSVANESSIAAARLGIITLSKELEFIEGNVQTLARDARKDALGSLSHVGRDQLILFLVLLFAIPVFLAFVPSWLVAPLSRLRQVAQKIELGKLKEIGVSGRDEVAVLARSLKSFLLKKEDLENKKSSKIFEMRNILRSLINRVTEPVFIVDEGYRINYTNDAAASLIGLPSHQMEGKGIADCLYSPMLKKEIEKALMGDAANDAILVNIEVADGREFTADAKIGVVRNRDGDVSRTVVVLHLAPDAVLSDR